MVPPNNLRVLRLREGITITELSRAARLSAKTTAKAERGLGNTSPTTRHRLVNALNELAREGKYGLDAVFPTDGDSAASQPAPKDAAKDAPMDDFVFTEALRRNCAWMTTNTEDLTPYEDKWIAICSGQIVASGEWPKDATENAAAAGHAGEETLLVYIGDDNTIY